MAAGMRMAIVGFGEVGQIFARQFHGAGVTDIAVYDIVFGDDAAPQIGAAAAGPWTRAASARDAAKGADVIVSAVTAGSAFDAAQSVTGAMSDGRISSGI